MNKRFTVQILGNVDYESYMGLLGRIQEVLDTFPNFTATTVNVTTWQDSDGRVREFDSKGQEVIAIRAPMPAASGVVTPAPEVEVSVE